MSLASIFLLSREQILFCVINAIERVTSSSFRIRSNATINNQKRLLFGSWENEQNRCSSRSSNWTVYSWVNHSLYDWHVWLFWVLWREASVQAYLRWKSWSETTLFSMLQYSLKGVDVTYYDVLVLLRCSTLFTTFMQRYPYTFKPCCNCNDIFYKKNCDAKRPHLLALRLRSFGIAVRTFLYRSLTCIKIMDSLVSFCFYKTTVMTFSCFMNICPPPVTNRCVMWWSTAFEP